MPIPDFVIALRRKIGNDLLFLPGVTAAVFNDLGQVLLTRRSDNGRWGIVGGVMEPGDSPAGAIVREVREETSLDVEIERLSGVYTEPEMAYSNGDRAQYVTVCFRCRVVAGEARVNDDESVDVRWFSPDALPDGLLPKYRQSILDALPPGRDLPAKFGQQLPENP